MITVSFKISPNLVWLSSCQGSWPQRKNHQGRERPFATQRKANERRCNWAASATLVHQEKGWWAEVYPRSLWPVSHYGAWCPHGTCTSLQRCFVEQGAIKKPSDISWKVNLICTLSRISFVFLPPEAACRTKSREPSARKSWRKLERPWRFKQGGTRNVPWKTTWRCHSI